MNQNNSSHIDLVPNNSICRFLFDFSIPFSTQLVLIFLAPKKKEKGRCFPLSIMRSSKLNPFLTKVMVYK